LSAQIDRYNNNNKSRLWLLQIGTLFFFFWQVFLCGSMIPLLSKLCSCWFSLCQVFLYGVIGHLGACDLRLWNVFRADQIHSETQSCCMAGVESCQLHLQWRWQNKIVSISGSYVPPPPPLHLSMWQHWQD
jgi:hypothetical protein